jgi:hypothetical protein
VRLRSHPFASAVSQRKPTSGDVDDSRVAIGPGSLSRHDDLAAAVHRVNLDVARDDHRFLEMRPLRAVC